MLRVIRSVRGNTAGLLLAGRFAPRFPANLARLAARKLEYLTAATVIEDLRLPPGNRLEALRGDRAGQHSIRINERWRICFTWKDGDAHDVEVVDYH